jgi:hypothetical protein
VEIEVIFGPLSIQTTRGSNMSHHYSGHDYGFPHGDVRLDLTDLYAFPKPGDIGGGQTIIEGAPVSTAREAQVTAAADYRFSAGWRSDPAIDVFLSILTNGKVTRDNVGPQTDLLTSSPYVHSPHKIRSAERVAA